jgi:(2Fe-2S) ferredoxin
MPPFTHHLFVCCNQRSSDNPRGSCDPDGSGQLRSALKACLKRHKIQGVVRANSAGCLDQCELGAVLVIYPAAIWYGHVTLDDVERIVEKTLIGGEILEDLLIDDDQLNAKLSCKTEQ